MMERWLKIAASAAVGAVLAASGAVASLPAEAAAHDPVTLTLWENYGTESEATATVDLARAFEKLHPDIKIKVVSQPASNYFSLLQAAAISKTGPDLAVMWTGLFALQYKDFLLNLNPYIPLSQLERFNGIQWASNNFNPKDGVLVVPLENQFYIGFYNKAMFRKAGIKAPPRTWSELYQDCRLLKKAGFLPMLYGAGSQNLGAEFYPFYDFSYMMIGQYPLSSWKRLYSGQIPWTSPAIVAQVNRWVQLYKDGFTNKDVLTNINSLGEFEQGKAAMLIKGNWDLSVLQQKMGSNLGVFLPPYSEKPIHGVVQFPGDGFSVTSYSQHKPQAILFLKFLMTPEAQEIEARDGLIPDLKGFTTKNALANAMLAFAAKDHDTAYPMLDNVIQPEVVSAAAKELDAAFGGATSVRQALLNMQETLQQLPASRRGTSYQ
jgi:raffinose/stachyose/melibiose transport system substrate-binding protein